MSNALLAWGDSIRHTIEDAEAILSRFRRLGRPPQTDDLPGARLDGLLDIWVSLVNEDADNPAASAADRFSQKLNAQAQAIGNDFSNMLMGIEEEIHRLLAKNAYPSEGWISSAEFGVGGVGRIQRNAGFLAVGALSALPPQHPYRSLIDPANLPHWGGAPSMILGPCKASMMGRAVPRPAYRVSQARYFSKLLRSDQDEEEKKRKKQREEQERMQLAAAQADPRWHLERLRTRVAELEREVGARRTVAGLPPEC
jgi:hypothetical protein